jgi:hypothetical protein
MDYCVEKLAFRGVAKNYRPLEPSSSFVRHGVRVSLSNKTVGRLINWRVLAGAKRRSHCISSENWRVCVFEFFNTIGRKRTRDIEHELPAAVFLGKPTFAELAVVAGGTGGRGQPTSCDVRWPRSDQTAGNFSVLDLHRESALLSQFTIATCRSLIDSGSLLQRHKRNDKRYQSHDQT